jgi:prepilin-type N-terminal cleavage/methylation domain-containing protein
VDRRSGTSESGFTLIEIVIAVAVVAMTVAAGFGVSLASRSFAVSAAATEFDHLLDSTRTIAREVQGATLAFVPDAYGDGTEVRVLAGAGSGALTPTTLPALHTRATIEEVESLRKPPFAFIVHVTGALGGRPGFRVGDTNANAEVGCPAAGAFHFVIRAAGGSADRYVPCRITLAANGPVTLATWPRAPSPASPTPCGGPCAPPTMPSAPSSSPSCPPNYSATTGGCAPSPPPSSGPPIGIPGSGSPTATPSPTPVPCDLTANGKCYHRIVDKTDQVFFKYVVPDTVCNAQGVPDCSYVDSIHDIQLGPSYSVTPVTPPVDSAHELLFKIDRTGGILDQCSPYDVIKNLPGSAPFIPGGFGSGSPQNAPMGFGQPTLYLTVNHVFASAADLASSPEPTVWPVSTTLLDLFEAVAQQRVGDAYTFTYSSARANSSLDIVWSPDFPGCDVSGPFGRQYGIVSLELIFEVYQALP